jgi:hypothetical protein
MNGRGHEDFDHMSESASVAGLAHGRVGMGHDHGRKMSRPGKSKHRRLTITLSIR